MNLKPFLSLLFFEHGISFTILCVFYEVPLEGSISLFLFLGLSFYFVTKKGVTFGYFLKHFFLDCIEVEPKSRF